MDDFIVRSKGRPYCAQGRRLNTFAPRRNDSQDRDAHLKTRLQIPAPGYNRAATNGRNAVTDILIDRNESSSVGQQIARGVLGGIFGGKRPAPDHLQLARRNPLPARQRKLKAAP